MLKRPASNPLRPVSHRLALEPRQLFDGAALVSVEQHSDQPSPDAGTRAAQDSLHPVTALPGDAPSLSPGNAHSLVVIDPAIQNWQAVIPGLPTGTQVLVLNQDSPATAQIAAALAERSDITALHLLSHGSADRITLAGQTLDSRALADFSADLAQIGQHLSADADILIYACDVASQGTDFISRLAALTGADVAASTNLTGTPGSGGDAVLETRSGRIEAQGLSLNGLAGLLAAPTITDTVTATRSASEDTPLSITGISVADGDGDAQTVTLTSSTGTLTLATTAGLGGLTGNGTGSLSFSGSLAQVNAALAGMSFQGLSDASGAASFTLATDDGHGGSASQTVNLVIAPVNDAPTLGGGTALLVNEGGSASFSAATVSGSGFTQAQLGLGDIDNSRNQVIIKIAALPGDGTLKLGANELSVGSTLSVSQLTQLSYTHNGSQVTNPAGMLDSFSITVDDGAGGLLVNQPVQVRIAPVNQAPSVVGNIRVIEGEPDVRLDDNSLLVAPISEARGAITIADPEAAPLSSYSITSLPSHGTLKYDGVAITAASVGAPFAFTDLSRLTYSHDGSETTNDSFNLTATDDGGGTGTPATTSGTINLIIEPNDKDPVLARDVTQTMAAGSTSLTLTTGMLQVTDEDSPTSTLTYTLTGVPNPAEGYFTLNGQTLVVGSTFTQADIDTGKVAYVTRSATPRTDSIRFTVKDGDRRLYPTPRDGGIYLPGTDTLAENSFSIVVPGTVIADGGGLPGPSAIDAAPSTGGSNSASLLEGESITVTSATLGASDPDTPDSQLVYRLLTLPTSGTLSLDGNVLGYYTSFTQQQINDGRVVFTHSGGEDFIDHLSYSVSDGKNVSGTRTLNFTVTPQNDTPTAALANRIFLVEGVSQPITTGNIRLADADNSISDLTPETGYAIDNTLSFRISGNVSHGTLSLGGVAVTPGVTVVTAAQLAAGDLVYQHDGSENYSDSFKLIPLDDQGVSSPTATNKSSTGAELTVPITISPLNDAPHYQSKNQLVSGEAGPLAEGATAIIGGASSYPNLNGIDGAGPPTPSAGAHLVFGDDDNSREQRQYRVMTAPTNGQLRLNGTPLAVGSVFTQEDLDLGRISYRHDGTETTSDYFEYLVSDGDFVANDSTAVPQGSIPSTLGRYNIEITPSNDAPTLTAPSGPVNIDSASTAHNPVSGFVVADPDLTAGVGTGETDYVQVTVRLLQADNTPFAAADYSSGGNTLLTVDLSGGASRDSDKDGNGDYLVLRGSRAQVNAALASLAVTFPDDRDTQYQLQVIADDRLRDGSGVLTSGANGGPDNQASSPGGAPTAVPATEYDWYTAATPASDPNLIAASVVLRASSINDPATLAGPGAQTIAEDVATPISGFTVDDPESIAFDLPVTVTLSLPGGQGSLGIAGAGSQSSISVGGRSVSISGDNSGTLILSGRADDIQTLLNDPSNGLSYQSPADGNHDYNGAAAGDLTLTVSLDDGSAGIGGDTGSGSQPANPPDLSIPITLTAINDAPTVAAAGTAATVAQGGLATPIAGFVVNDVDYSDGGGISATGESDFIQVIVRIADNAGTPLAAAAYVNGGSDEITIASSSAPAEGAGFEIDNSLDGTGSALVIRGTRANVNAYLAGLTVTFDGSLTNVDQTYQVQVIADDRLRDLSSGALDGSTLANGGPNPGGAVPVTVIDPYAALPGGLSANVGSGSRELFVSGINDPALVSAVDVTVNENAATLDLTSAVGAFTLADPDDNGAATLSATVTVDQGVISAVGGSGGTVAGTGTASITLTGATEAQLNARLQALTLAFPDEPGTPAAADWNGSVHVTVVVSDGGNTGQRPGSLPAGTASLNNGAFSFADGSSATLVTTRTITVTVNGVNDAPVRSDATPVSLAPVAEDSSTPAGDTVANLFAGKFDDSRDGISGGSSPNAFAGIAITTNNAVAAQGQWQYSSDGLSWTSLPAISSASALLLQPTDHLRFVPAADFHGTPGSLVARLADDSAGALVSGGSVDVSNDSTLSGGTTPFSDSSNAVTLGTTISPVNDAPTLAAASLSPVNEDVSSAANTGSPISSLFGSQYSDATDNRSGITGGGNTSTAMAGLAVLSNSVDPATQGRWQYSVSPGVWVDLPTGANLGGSSNAVILPTSASLRFQPVADYNGTPPALGVSALDSSAGSISAPQTGQTIAATGGSTRYSPPTTLGASVTPVNDAPTISALAGSPAFTENAANPVRLDSDGTVAVSDKELGNNWNGATLTVQRSGSAKAEDSFSLIDSNPANPALGVQTSGSSVVVDGVTVGSFSTSGGTLSISFNSNASAASVGAVMGAVGYRNTSDAPPAAAQINFVLNDQNSNASGGGTAGTGQDQGRLGRLSAQTSVTVAITQINDAPAISGLDSLSASTYTENDAPVQIDANATLSDPELDADRWQGATLSLARQGGAQAEDVFGATGVLSFSGSGSGNVLVSGLVVGSYTQSGGQLDILFNANASPARVDQVMQGLSYRNSSDDPPASVTLAYTVNDQNTGASGTIAQGSGGALSASGSITLAITRINDAPVISAAPPAAAYIEQGSPAVVDAGFTLTDPDDTQLASASVRIASPVSGDLLSVSTAGTAISASYDAASGLLSLSGSDSLAHYQSVLRSLSFSSTSDDPTADTARPSRSLSITVTDANSDGAGARSTTATRSVNVTPVNDTPQINGLGSVSYTENAAPVAAAPALTLADADDTRLVSATVRIVGGFVTGDRLNFSAQSGITGSYDPATATLSLSGSASLAQYQAALRSISFDTPSENPGSGTRSLAWSVTDADSDLAGPQTSLVGISQIQLIPVNDPPLARDDANSLGKTATTPASGNVLANDSDVDGGPLTVTALTGGSPGQPLLRPSGSLILNPDGSYSFTVNTADPAVAALGAGQSLTETYTYTVSDGLGGTSSATLSITIFGANNPPVARPDANSIAEGTPTISAAASGVLGNDSDINPGDVLRVTGLAPGADQPAGSATPVPTGGASVTGTWGSLTLNPDGSYSYALDNSKPGVNALAVGESLTDSFTYLISDGKGGSASTNLVITINGRNDPPDAVDDRARLPANAAQVQGNTLSNDHDPDSSDTLTVSAVNGSTASVGTPVSGSYGSLVLNPDGSYTYTPNGTSSAALPAGSSVNETFTYTISDGHGGTDTATLTITLRGANDSPVARPDGNGVDEDQTGASGNVLGGLATNGSGVSSSNPAAIDTDADSGDTLAVTAFHRPGGTSASPGQPLAGQYGSLSLNADGSYSYLLDNANPQVQALRAGETRQDSFVYTISDSQSATASTTLDILITGTNDAPTANPDHYDTVDSAGPPGGTPIRGNVLVNDSDPDANTRLLVSAVSGSAPGSVGGNTSGSFGTLVLNPDGSFSYAVDTSNPVINSLQVGESRTDTFTYTITDGDGGTSTATITITIHGTNNSPSALDDNGHISEDDPPLSVAAAGGVLANDSDPDGDPLTVVDISLPAGSGGAIGSPLAGRYGSLTLNPDGGYSYSLDNSLPAVQALNLGESLTDSFVYTSSDGRGSFVQATLSITIDGRNDAPVARPDSNGIAEDSTSPALGNVLPNDSDVDTGNTLSVTGLGGGGIGTPSPGNYGSLTLQADGSYSYVLDNSLPAVQALGPGQSLTETFTYTVSDGHGGSASSTLTITISGDNDPPIAVADVLAAREDGPPASGDLTPGSSGQDSDVDGGPLVVTAIANAAGQAGSLGTPLAGSYGSLVVAADGSHTYTVDNASPLVQALGAGQTVTDTFTYTISDGLGGTATSTLTVTITGRQDPPTAVNDGIFTTHEDTPLRNIPVLVNDSDPEGDPLTVTAASVPASQGTVRINPDGSLDFTPAKDFNGTALITYTISDGHGGSATATVTIAVAPVNDPPTGADKTVEILDGQRLPLRPADFGYADVDGDPLAALRIDSLPQGGGTLLLDGVPVVAGQIIPVADLAAGKLVLVSGAATEPQSFRFSLYDGQAFQQQPNTFTATIKLSPRVDPAPPDHFPLERERPTVDRLFPPFVPSLHVLPGVADTRIERSLFAGPVKGVAERVDPDEARSALLYAYADEAHALFVQHAVRQEPLSTAHALHVQNAVRASQAESSLLDAQADSRNSSATPGIASLFDPFTLGTPASPPEPEGHAAPPPAPHPAPKPKAAEGFSSQLRNAAAELRPKPLRLAQGPLLPASRR